MVSKKEYCMKKKTESHDPPNSGDFWAGRRFGQPGGFGGWWRRCDQAVDRALGTRRDQVARSRDVRLTEEIETRRLDEGQAGRGEPCDPPVMWRVGGRGWSLLTSVDSGKAALRLRRRLQC